jgi:hypothetical protein
MKQFLNVLHVYNILLLDETTVQALKVAMPLEPFSHSPILAAASRKSLKENRFNISSVQTSRSGAPSSSTPGFENPGYSSMNLKTQPKTNLPRLVQDAAVQKHRSCCFFFGGA